MGMVCSTPVGLGSSPGGVLSDRRSLGGACRGARPVVRRLIVGLLAALLGAGLVAPGVLAAPSTTGVPKVVLVVGPAGGPTDRYRSEARKAAALARKYTPDVTEIYSPNATWPAVKKALQGASLVIYMGHGNGWPSRYRDELYPPSQNGFGLNPSAGSGDSTHQYFGEARIAESIQLAPNAVVLLNHLCYASGNTEPGLPEGTLAMAKQRVDNFAAGFIRAGAAAVVAEAYTNPNHMVRSVLAGRGGIEIRMAPRTERERQHFRLREPYAATGTSPRWTRRAATRASTRSIVLKRGLASKDVLSHARGRAAGSRPTVDPASLVPSLSGTGLTIKMPTLRSTVAGATLWYRIPYAIRSRNKLPDDIQASVRWDPLDPAASSPADPDVAPDFGLVTPERIGDVVAPSALRIDKKNLSIRVTAPAAPGRYRLSVSLHDKEGVAYDATSQAMLPSLIVRLTGPHDAGVVGPDVLEIAPGAAHELALWVTNLGHREWGQKAVPGARTVDNARNPTGSAKATNARLVGTWVSLGGVDDPAQTEAAAAASVRATALPPGFAPRAVTKAEVLVFAPSAPGDYLLVVDIVTPEIGSLAAQGVDPTIVRVHVAVPVAEPAEPETSTQTQAVGQGS